MCVLPPAGDRGGLVAEGDRADEDFDLGPAPSSGLATTPRTSPWVRTLPWVAAESSRRSPAPFLLPRPPSDASGATRASRGDAALSVVSGAPARAGSSCRQRPFIGRSVGTAESPEPPTPSMRGVSALRLPRARASWLFGGWRFQSPVTASVLTVACDSLGGGSEAALSAASQGWRAAAGGWVIVAESPRILADRSPC